MHLQTSIGFTPKIVTGNDLLEGDVIYLTSDWKWSRHLAAAELFEDAKAAARALEFANGQKASVLSAYLVDAFETADGRPHPTHFREVLRMTGPSNRFHGKQAAPAFQE